MKKNSKVLVVVLVALFVAIIMVSLFIFGNKKDEPLYGDNREVYLNYCPQAMGRSFLMSSQKMNAACNCSHDTLLSILGEGAMKRYTEAALEKDKDAMNKILSEERIIVEKFDAAVLNCFY
jgi:hypothetical protein